MKKSSLLIAVAACALFGAGCGSSPVAIENYQTTPSTPAPVATTPTPPMPTSPTPAPSNATTTPSAAALAFPGILPAKQTTGYIHIKTNKGNIVFELLAKEGPKAASNFVYLVNKKFYDGLTFHRVVPGFVIQGGDPLGNGTGNPGYRFEDDSVKLPYKKGIVAMANAGPNTNGSQFFIMLDDHPELPPNYSVFGRVVSGQDVVEKIAIGDVMETVTLSETK